MSDFLLLESRSLRKQLCTEENTFLLERAGQLITLNKEGWTTTKNVAKFFDVPSQTIKNIVFDYKEELDSDGYKVLSGNEIREFPRETLKSKARKIAIFPRRAVLRLAMILRDSAVAKTIRTYLLNHEEKISSESLMQVANQLGLHATQLSQSAKQLTIHANQLNQHAVQIEENAGQLVAQSRIICALTNEIYYLKENQKNVALQLDDYNMRLKTLESKDAKTISKKQIAILQSRVKRTGSPAKIWRRFNKAFGINRYANLPEDKFDEALKWIENTKL